MQRVYAGKELARVLMFYGIIQGVDTSVFSIICPFHDDVNPSMRIDLNDGTFFCFGCRRTGNAYDFIKNMHPELNDLQACILLEKILHSDEVRKYKFKIRRKKRKRNKQAIIEAKDYYYGLRTVDWNNVETEEEQQVLEYMQERGFSPRALNVARCKASCNPAYPILFPLLDNGKFMGWVARTTNKRVEKNRCKYMYNEGFRKRDTLCGNYEEGKVPFICEGFMDYLSLRTRGHVKNTVALLGWHISDEQVEKLKQKGITTVVSALDNDECGEKGTEYLKNFFNVVRFDYPKNKKDVGEMSEEAIKRALKRTRRRYKEVIDSR